MKNFQKNQCNNGIIIYTDGSKSENDQIGAGIVSINDFKNYGWEAWNLGKKCEIFDAELFALKKVMEFALKTLIQEFKKSGFFSDS
jgi:hypothetical protein